MGRYVQKLLEVEAVQWFKHGDHPAVRPCTYAAWAESLSTQELDKSLTWQDIGMCGETDQLVMPGDWILNSEEGEHYPVRGDVFAKCYREIIEWKEVSSPSELTVNYSNFPSQNWHDSQGNPSGGYSHGTGFTIVWQQGPIKVQGVNGASIESVIDACIDRLKFFQLSSFACQYNEMAIDYLKFAIDSLATRTKEREVRGVEGTNKI